VSRMARSDQPRVSKGWESPCCAAANEAGWSSSCARPDATCRNIASRDYRQRTGTSIAMLFVAQPSMATRNAHPSAKTRKLASRTCPGRRFCGILVETT